MANKRWKIRKDKSKKLFKKTSRPVTMNKTRQTGRGIKRGGTRL